MAILTDDELREALADRRAWRRVGDALVRERACRDFAEALVLLERLGETAEDYGRHPEMTVSDGARVRIRVANPNGAGFTDAELRLVAKVDQVTAAIAAEEAAPPRPRGPLAAVAAAVAAVPLPLPDLAPTPAPAPASATPGPQAPAPAPAPGVRGRRGVGVAVAAIGGALVGAAAVHLVHRS